MKLLDPIDYLKTLMLYQRRMVETYGFLRIRKFTSGKWGQYILEPMNIQIGVIVNGEDDFEGIDIGDWNERAKETLEKLKKLKAFT